MRYNRQLMMAILHDRVSIAKNVNATPISLDQAPRGYEEFHQGAARKYVLDPHGMVGQRALPSDGGTSSQDRKYVAGPASR